MQDWLNVCHLLRISELYPPCTRTLTLTGRANIQYLKLYFFCSFTHDGDNFCSTVTSFHGQPQIDLSPHMKSQIGRNGKDRPPSMYVYITEYLNFLSPIIFVSLIFLNKVHFYTKYCHAWVIFSMFYKFNNDKFGKV